MKKALLITTTLLSLSFYGQTKEQKVEFIINELGYFNSIKGAIIDFHIPNLKNFGNKNDVRIQALEDQLNDWEIIRRLSNAIDKTFTEKEISEIYKFYNSQTGKKLVLSQNIIDENIKDNFIDIFEEINTIRQDNENLQNRQAAYLMAFFQAIHDKKDGFYLVSEEKLNNNETEFEISEKAAFEPKDIEDIRSSYNDLENLIIDIKFKENVKSKLQEITANNINKGMAIIVDKKIITMPIIYSEIADGKLQISGLFSVEEIKNIVSKLKK